MFGRLLATPSAVVVLETVLLAILQFGTYSVLIRVTDAATIGLWVLVNALLSFARVADFWSRGLSSFVGEARGASGAQDAHGFVVTATLSAAIGYLVAALIAYGVIHFAAGWLVGPQHAQTVRAILPLMIITFWLGSVAGVYQLGFLGFERPRLKAAQTVGGALLFLSLSLLLAPAKGLVGILIAQAIQAGAMLVFAITAYHLRVAAGLQFPGWTKAKFKAMARHGVKAIGLGVMQLAIEPVIRLLANAFGGLAAVAVVELASRLIGFARSLILSMGQILEPSFARLSQASRQETARLLRVTEQKFLLLGLAAFSMLLSAGPLVAIVILGQSSGEFTGMLWLLSLGWLSNLLAGPSYFLMIGQRRLRPLFESHFIMIAGSIAAGWLLGSAFGLYGALAGVSAAIIASSWQLRIASAEDRLAHGESTPGNSIGWTGGLPFLAASTAFLPALYLDGVRPDAWVRIIAILSPILLTALAVLLCLPLWKALSSLRAKKSNDKD